MLNHAGNKIAPTIKKLIKGSSEITDAKYQKLSDNRKSKYVKMPKEALVEKRVDTVVSTITPSGPVVVKNTTITEVWGKTVWVKSENLYRSTLNSETLYSISKSNSNTRISYDTYEYSNSWFHSSMETLGNALYPRGYNDKNIYENKSQYTSGSLTPYLNFLK